MISSLRSALRATPRSVARLNGASTSPASFFCRQAATRTLHSSTAIPLTSRVAAMRTSQLRGLSTSVYRGAPAGETDEELSAKLESEIQFENEVKEGEPLPASVKDFLDNSAFEIVDVPGQEEVVLTRTFGNEKITVTFSIADLANYDEAEAYDEDAALADEDAEGDIPAAAPGTGSSGAQTGNDLADEPTEDELAEVEADAAVPCRLNIVVEKEGKGALNIEATAQDGSILVENLYYFADAALAHGKNADAAHAAQDVYPGPPFGSLDEDLQILMERYLEERGITQALAVFVPDYMDAKEQREYLAWLNNLKAFVDA